VSEVGETCDIKVNWEPLPECLSRWTGYALHWVADLSDQLFAGAISTINLTPSQLGVLRLLQSSGPMVQAQISRRLRIDKAMMVGLLNDLEAQGLVKRMPHLQDQRAFLIHLLEPAEQRLLEAEKICQKVDRHFFASFTPDEQQTLHELLKRLAITRVSLMQLEE
jgi:DNA-binding MarR family transcriptional regulator